MALLSAICTQCGAALNVDNSYDVMSCPYCSTVFVVEKAINKYTSVYNTTINKTVIGIDKSDSEELITQAQGFIKLGYYEKAITILANGVEHDVLNLRLWLNLIYAVTHGFSESEIENAVPLIGQEYLASILKIVGNNKTKKMEATAFLAPYDDVISKLLNKHMIYISPMDAIPDGTKALLAEYDKRKAKINDEIASLNVKLQQLSLLAFKERKLAKDKKRMLLEELADIERQRSTLGIEKTLKEAEEYKIVCTMKMPIPPGNKSSVDYAYRIYSSARAETSRIRANLSDISYMSDARSRINEAERKERDAKYRYNSEKEEYDRQQKAYQQQKKLYDKYHGICVAVSAYQECKICLDQIMIR